MLRAVGFCVALLAAAAPAHALFGDDEARKAILELRKQLAEQDRRIAALAQALEKQSEFAARLERLEAAQRGALEFANQMDALRQDLAKLRGQIDLLANELANVQKKNRDLYGDLDARLKRLEPATVTIDGRPALVDRAEQAAFDAALAQFRAGDFRGATASLQAFIARYPQSPYGAAAYYWLGNAHYQLKDYKAAIAAQQTVVEKYADSTRAPEALLNIAASQIELNDRRSARATLQRIIKDYPDTEAARLAKERLPATTTR
jgi:tol-pal system protein YbgF